jgi:hypothetical protein
VGRRAADWARLKGHESLLSLLGGNAEPSAPMALSDGLAREAAPAPAMYHTGIKALDLFAPLHEGDFVLVQGGARVGRNIFIAELADVARRRGDTHSVWVMWQRELWSDAELDGLLNETHLRNHVQVLRAADAAGAQAAREQPSRALALAERLLAEGAKHVQLTFFERPGVRTALEALRPSIGRRSDGRVEQLHRVICGLASDAVVMNLDDTGMRELAERVVFALKRGQRRRGTIAGRMQLLQRDIAPLCRSRTL